MLDDADRIWNRACDPFAEHAAAGDQALQAILVVHGQVMNSGLVSALEYKDADEILSAVSGFRYFALEHAAGCLADAFQTAFPTGGIEDAAERGAHLDALGGPVHERLEWLEADYYAALPHDQIIEAAFRDRLRASPSDFASPNASGS
jgi:hypothetical protein